MGTPYGPRVPFCRYYLHEKQTLIADTGTFYLYLGYTPAPRPRNEVLTSILNTASMEPRNMGAILHGVLVGAIVPPERARRQLTMPALIVGHGGDKLHEFRDAHTLHQELRNSTLLEARHILELRTRPDRLWPEIRRFFTAVKAAETGQGTAGKRRTGRKAG